MKILDLENIELTRSSSLDEEDIYLVDVDYKGASSIPIPLFGVKKNIITGEIALLFASSENNQDFEVSFEDFKAIMELVRRKFDGV